MACEVQIPGLTCWATRADLEHSRQKYNALRSDEHQPEVELSILQELAEIFVRNRAHKVFGIHLPHGHFNVPEGKVLVGVDTNQLRGRWTAPTSTTGLDLNSIHGHVFVLTDAGFHPYEYQTGNLPDLTDVDANFFPEVAEFIQKNNFRGFIALEVLRYQCDMMELVIDGQGTIMLDNSVLKNCKPYKQTCWRFTANHGAPRVCQEGRIYHAEHKDMGHVTIQDDMNIESHQDIWVVLRKAGILNGL